MAGQPVNKEKAGRGPLFIGEPGLGYETNLPSLSAFLRQLYQ